jgi:hypothetical protein
MIQRDGVNGAVRVARLAISAARQRNIVADHELRL